MACRAGLVAAELELRIRIGAAGQRDEHSQARGEDHCTHVPTSKSQVLVHSWTSAPASPSAHSITEYSVCRVSPTPTARAWQPRPCALGSHCAPCIPPAIHVRI